MFCCRFGARAALRVILTRHQLHISTATHPHVPYMSERAAGPAAPSSASGSSGASGAGAAGYRAAALRSRSPVAAGERAVEGGRPWSQYGLHKLDERELNALWAAASVGVLPSGSASAARKQRFLDAFFDKCSLQSQERVIHVQVGRAGEPPRTSFDMQFVMGTSIATVKDIVQMKEGIPAHNQRITCTWSNTTSTYVEELIDQHDLAHYDASFITVEEVGVKIRKMDGIGFFLALGAAAFNTTTVYDVKRQISRLTGLPCLNQQILFRDQVLENNQAFGECGVQSNAELQLVIGDVLPLKAPKPGQLPIEFYE